LAYEKKNKKSINVALAGNPNSGKTSVFNAVTGMKQYVGNWPGVTVEKVIGKREIPGGKLEITDLPGTYSLSPYSPDEKVARDYLLFERPDVVCIVVDASNLERNLYLVAQIVELDLPMVIALNMIDIAHARDIQIEVENLSRLLKAPVIPTIGRAGEGIDELIESILCVANQDFCPPPLDYGSELEKAIIDVEKEISVAPQLISRCHMGRFISAMLLAGDPEITKMVLSASNHTEPIRKHIAKCRMVAEKRLRTDIETALANARHGWASGIYHEVVKNPRHQELTNTDRIDNILSHRILGFPIFAAIMFFIFWATFNVGAYPMGLIEKLFELISNLIDSGLAQIGTPEILISLLVDGAISGAGGVLVFLPNIIILFFFISVLEDVGYMARAAFLMDKVMHKMGLHGKSFIPIIIGFGCTVPAVMATRTLENQEDRLLTILILPFVLCSARIPVFVLFSGTFFAENAGLVMFSMYVLSILTAVFAAKLLKTVLFPGLSTPFVMELPPYHIPSLRGVLLHTWERAWAFVKKAGTIILIGSVFIWALSNLPPGVDYAGEESLAGMIGKLIEPLVVPFGANWQAAVALLFGFVAKEIVVSSFSVLLSSGTGIPLSTSLATVFTPLSAYAFMVFALIYTPCIATVAVIKKETGSWKWTIFSVLFSVSMAFVLATLTYWGGKLLGLG